MYTDKMSALFAENVFFGIIWTYVFLGSYGQYDPSC